jgi:hypothetical protein
VTLSIPWKKSRKKNHEWKVTELYCELWNTWILHNYFCFVFVFDVLFSLFVWVFILDCFVFVLIFIQDLDWEPNCLRCWFARSFMAFLAFEYLMLVSLGAWLCGCPGNGFSFWSVVLRLPLHPVLDRLTHFHHWLVFLVMFGIHVPNNFFHNSILNY